MAIKYIIVLFVETPRKFIAAKLSIRKPGSSSVLINLVPRACDPREGTRGSGIIRFREESDWPLK